MLRLDISKYKCVFFFFLSSFFFFNEKNYIGPRCKEHRRWGDDCTVLKVRYLHIKVFLNCSPLHPVAARVFRRDGKIPKPETLSYFKRMRIIFECFFFSLPAPSLRVPVSNGCYSVNELLSMVKKKKDRLKYPGIPFAPRLTPSVLPFLICILIRVGEKKKKREDFSNFNLADSVTHVRVMCTYTEGKVSLYYGRVDGGEVLRFRIYGYKLST